jgi:ferredoxin
MADPRVLQTPLGWLFVAGDVVHGAGMAVRSVGDGRVVAESIRQWLAGRPVTGRVRPFNSRIGKLLDGELAGFLAGADARGRIHPAGDGLSPAEAELEAERCLDCDCRKAVTCRLRRFADAYGVDQDELRPEIRGAVEVQRAHARVVFEGGKCIKCGICVRLTAQRGVPGMTFAGRGYDAIVAPPFGTDLAAAFGEAALDCAEACPTAAIAVEWEET